MDNIYKRMVTLKLNASQQADSNDGQDKREIPAGHEGKPVTGLDDTISGLLGKLQKLDSGKREKLLNYLSSLFGGR